MPPGFDLAEEIEAFCDHLDVDFREHGRRGPRAYRVELDDGRVMIPARQRDGLGWAPVASGTWDGESILGVRLFECARDNEALRCAVETELRRALR